MMVAKILLIVLFVIIIAGSFFSIYKDVTSTGNIKTTKQLSATGSAIVGIYVDNPNNPINGVKNNEK